MWGPCTAMRMDGLGDNGAAGPEEVAGTAVRPSGTGTPPSQLWHRGGGIGRSRTRWGGGCGIQPRGAYQFEQAYALQVQERGGAVTRSRLPGLLVCDAEALQVQAKSRQRTGNMYVSGMHLR